MFHYYQHVAHLCRQYHHYAIPIIEAQNILTDTNLNCLLFCVFSGCLQCMASGVANYKVTFTSAWTSPVPPASNPHWSAPVGISHSPCYTMWRPGTLASPGIRAMAEVGRTSLLTTEFGANSKCFVKVFPWCFLHCR